jgi:hypothetical protein
MIVTVQYQGEHVTGLRVGSGDVRKYFSKRIQDVELHMGDLAICCPLSPGFWHDRPELHDPRISVWLESKNLRGKRNSAEIRLAMVPSGKNSFRLNPIPLSAHSQGIEPMSSIR